MKIFGVTLTLGGMLDEPDTGKISFSRVATVFLIIVCVIWDSFIVFKTRSLPDFGGQAIFISTLYGLNQLKNLASALTPTTVALAPAKTTTIAFQPAHVAIITQDQPDVVPDGPQKDT